MAAISNEESTPRVEIGSVKERYTLVVSDGIKFYFNYVFDYLALSVTSYWQASPLYTPLWFGSTKLIATH